MTRITIYVATDSGGEMDSKIDKSLEFCADKLKVPIDQSIERIQDELRQNTYIKLQSSDASFCIIADRTDIDGRTGDDPREKLKEIVPKSNHLVIPSIYEISTEFIDRSISIGDATVHACTTGISIHRNERGLGSPLRRALKRLKGERRDAEAVIDGIPHQGGRPPIGCRVENGMLRAAADYDKVCSTLQSVADGTLAKTDAAEELDCTRKTIDNGLQRRSLYSIQ